ncbi:GNAT family N-acetyltransferase [Pseudonocardia bannensis]|uniref:GNAT family N-acetyltransferase n=1 Tax=Pseudonocardia bannensis TaxID=630973 RepID=A0A848DP47_9PSEU|nr:GNAT family N-acetyltransferase [Pseudonocardia bannensis]NMH94508.1 GNAT family N-acetyltransferase [Pseudonocardia bannensis]
MRIDIVRGAAADVLLDQETFLRQWSDLCRNCPWATPFQGPDFATIWYRAYRRNFEPLLVLSHGPDGRLQGLLPLAVAVVGADRSGKDDLLVVAGAWQAEYQAWICPPQIGDGFAAAAVDTLHRAMPSAELRFRYLPPGTPTTWLDRTAPGLAHRLRRHRRPLMRFGDGSEIAASLRKGSNKTRLRRLEKSGGVEFRQLTSAVELDPLFDEVIAYHDARHLAVHGTAAFQEDPCKRPFHLAMADVTGLLHVTVMTVGGRVAAAHLGASGGTEVQLGVIAHDPWLSKHSPGKFHIYFLARMLREQGYEQLDLTAGGDPYKERFANAWDEVETLDLVPTSVARRRDVIRLARGGIRWAARRALAPLPVTPADVRSWAHEMRHRGPRGIAAALTRGTLLGAGPSRETRVYRYDLDGTGHSLPGTAGTELVGRNRLPDLLTYRPARSDPSRQRFLTTALRRIQEGQHVYTCTEDGRLLHVAWLVAPRTRTDGAAAPDVPRPPDSALVHDFYTAPEAVGRGLDDATLRVVLRDAARLCGAGSVAAAVPAGDEPARRAVEKSGFVYARSVAPVPPRRPDPARGDERRTPDIPAPRISSAKEKGPQRG